MHIFPKFRLRFTHRFTRINSTGLLRGRRQNVPVQSHTVARIGGLQDHHHHQQQQQQIFTVAVSPPPLQSGSAGVGQLQQPTDLASTVDLTSDGRAPIDYLTPPPNGDFQFLQSFQSPAGEPTTPNRPENAAAVQAPPPPLVPFAAPSSSSSVTVHTSSFVPGGSVFSSAQAQPPPTSLSSHAVQTSSPSNQVHSLTFANPPLEQFTPYTPSLTHEQPAANHQQQQQNGGRWELGFDASDILTPPFAGASELQPASSVSAGHGFFHQDFGQEAAGSVRSNKQYPAAVGANSGSLFFGGSGGFDASVAANTKFTPLDAVVRPSPSNKNVYWGTPKTAQQQPLRPSPSFAEPNAFRFNNNNNHHSLHQPNLHNNHNHHQLHQFVDSYQMPFTGQFDGPLSQGTVADHVVHSSFRIKRQLQDAGPPPTEAADRSDDERFGDRKPVYSFVKTDRNGNFKWSVRHGY